MNIPQHPRSLNGQRLASLTALSLGVLTSLASAANVTWVGNTSNLWNTGANWSTAAAPTAGSTLVFDAAGTSGLALTNNISTLTVGGSNADGITFGLSAGSYTLARSGSEVLTLGSSGYGAGIKNISNFLQTISAPLVLSGPQTIQVGETSGAYLSSLTNSGSLTGGQRLTKTGTGLLTLGSASNALGGLTVQGGVVSIGADTHLSATAPASPTAGWVVLDGGALRTNAASLTINANRGIAVGNINAGSGGTLLISQGTTTYNGVIANNTATASSLTKTGTGTLSLGGANTYTGATIVNQGQLTLDFGAAGAPSTNIINSASNLTLGGVPTLLNTSSAGNPIVLVQGGNSPTVPSSQTFGGLTLNPGNSNIVARGGTNVTDVTVALGAITQNAGGTVGLSQLTNTNTGRGRFTTTTANTHDILGAGVTIAAAVGSSGTAPLTQTDWAANDGSGNIVAYTGYTVAATGTPLANSAASNVRIDSTSTGNVTPTYASGLGELNTIQMTDASGTRGAATVTVGAGNTLRLGQFGGVWKASPTTAVLTIGASGANAGSLTAGGAADTAGSIVFNANGAASFNQSLVVNSAIVDNGTGVVSITKTGLATLVLNGTNTFTGGTFINQGVVIGNSLGAFGGGGRDVTVVNSGQVSLGNAGTYANNFNLSGTGLVITNGGTVGGAVTLLGDTNFSGTGTVSGKITGDFNLTNSQGTYTLSNTANDYSGNFGVNGVSTLGGLANNAAGVKLGASEVLSHGAGKGNVWLTISSGATGLVTLDLNGFNETINGLISGGSSAKWADARVINTSGSGSTLTLGGNDQTATFGGVISQTAGTIAITKIGAGIQTFGGVNTYTGNTTITGGTLALASTGSISNSAVIAVDSGATFNVGAVSGYTVASGQTLRGAGLVAGAVSAGSGATVAAGMDSSTVGALTFSGSLNLTGATVSLKLDSTAGTADLLFADSLTLGGATLSFADIGAGLWTGATTFTIANVSTGTISGTFLGLAEGDSINIGANAFTISYAGGTGNDITLSYTAVPEPSAYAALVGALALGAAAIRRRRVS